MKECDERSKQLRITLQDEECEHIPYIALTILIYNGYLINKSVSTLIREIDAKKCEQQYLELKIPDHYE